MKKIFTMVLCFVLVFSLAACSKTSVKIGEESSITEGNNFNITMDIIEGTVQSTGLTIRVTNNTDIMIESGNSSVFAIEVQKNGKWYSIEVDESANTANTMVFAGTCEMEIDWSRIYGVLPEGQYRIIKNFSPWTEDGSYSIDDRFCLIAEFCIE